MVDDSDFGYRYSGKYDPRLDPYLIALGELARSSSDFEFNVNDAIWELANVERKAGTTLTSHLIGSGPRFRCLISLLRLRDVPTELIKEINSLSGVAEGLARQRNRFLHDPMVWDQKDGSIHRMEATADRTVKHDIVPVELDEIRLLR